MANTWTNTKLQDQMLVLSFRNFTSVNVNRVYYISEKVEKLTLLGIKDKTFRNIRFEIENRTTPITIELNQFQFCAQDDQNAIYAQDATSASIKKINESYCMEIAGNSVLNLNAIGKCFIGGGTRNSYVLSDGVYPNKFCSAIVCANINLHNEKQGDVLVISGGNGADGITSDEKTEGFGASKKRDGKPGGSAIWACRLNIDCYGLLISENSISKILSHMLPIWKTKEPNLYDRFSGTEPFPEFGDYLNTHYDVNLYGNADALRYYRIFDQETSEQEIGDYFYFLDLNRSPSLFHTAYADFEEIIQEVKSRIGDILPPDFPFEEYLLEILGETWG